MADNIFADNHARGAVPEGELVSGVSLAVILIGLMLTLPMFVLGGEVISGLGAKRGAAAIAAAGLIVAVLASVTGFVGEKTRLSTYSIIIAPFGTIGARLLTALLASVAVGWFGVTVGFFGAAVDTAMREVAGAAFPVWAYSLGGGALMTGTVLFGFKGIDLLNRIAVPLLALVLIWSGAKLLGEVSWTELLATPARTDGAITSFGLGVSATLGILAGVAGGMPDLTRFARRATDVYVACLLSFASLSMAFAVLAGAPSLMTGSADFTANLIAVGLGAPALAALILATWTTNIINLYAASLSLGRLTRAPDWFLTLGAGAAGTGFALAGATQIFIGLLLVISALIPPIAGVYVTHFFLTGEAGEVEGEGRKLRASAFAAWGLGGATALTTTFTPAALTTVPAIDAFAVAAVVYALATLALRGAVKAP
ncbi:MAG: cytosine permease [Pseudomonadota bacterium]